MKQHQRNYLSLSSYKSFGSAKFLLMISVISLIINNKFISHYINLLIFSIFEVQNTSQILMYKNTMWNPCVWKMNVFIIGWLLHIDHSTFIQFTYSFADMWHYDVSLFIIWWDCRTFLEGERERISSLVLTRKVKQTLTLWFVSF